MKFSILNILVFFSFLTFGYGQLPDFALQVVPTNETCSSNGTIILIPSSTTAGATILYSLYKLPNLSTPIAQFSENSHGSMDSGDYRIIATQTLGNESSTPQQKDFTIIDQTIQLTLDPPTQSAVGSCDQTATLLINVATGNGPFFYEMLTGSPQVFPPQLSNQFSGLTGGEYHIRVIDACGAAEVQDWIVTLSTTVLTIGAAGNPPVASSCSTLEVINAVTPTVGTNIIYPITVEYTVHFPAGDQVITQVYTTGPPDELDLSLTLPLFATDEYTYDIKITDSCNHSVLLDDNAVDPNPVVDIFEHVNDCGKKYITVSVSNVMPPYTMNFTSVPAGFDPGTFNPDYNTQPLTALLLDFGNDTTPVPFGTYDVTITDSCGRSGNVSYILEKKEIIPTVTPSPPTCSNPGGIIRITIPENRKVAIAIITSAPPAYLPALPSNVSPVPIPVVTHSIPNLPVGFYDLTVTDDCGDVYLIEEVEIKPFIPVVVLTPTLRPSCSEGFGSLRLRSPNSGSLLNSLIMTAAPPAFDQTLLPLDLTASLINGMFFHAELPAGEYSFQGSDTCGVNLSNTFSVVGYNPGVNNFTVERNCGTFNLSVADQSNIIGSYWFQKFNEATNTWEHPETGVAYPDNTIPDETNSIILTNNSTKINITYTGTFRILKVYQSFDSDGNSTCFQPYESFTFSGDLQVLGAYSLDCTGGSGPSSVYLDVLGVPPYLFRIIKKDGIDFLQENGDNNVFTNLDVATYQFQVEDSCGRLEPIDVNLGTLLPLVNATDPAANGGHGELLFCGNGETSAVFDLTSFSATILGNQAPENYIVTYHKSQAEADSGANAITNPEAFTNTINPQPVFVRVVHKTIAVCHDTTSFDLFVGTAPILNTPEDEYLCDGDSVRIFADPGFDSYEWSTGETTSSILVEQSGVYTVTVSNVYGTSACSTTESITVTPSGTPQFESVDIQDWRDDDNGFTFHVSGSGDYVYSIDGINFQPDNTFTGLLPGLYNVFVNDLHGCPGITKEVLILSYPKFFTPNGDGYNETWKIKNAFLEPGMKIYIFDRYGKLITGFGVDSPGWDGTYNGKPLPSTDYWFLVERVDGKVHRGHFAMKR